MRKTGNDRDGRTDLARPGVRSVGPYSYNAHGNAPEETQSYSGYASYKSRVRAKKIKKLKKLSVIAAAALLVVVLGVLLVLGVFQKRYKITLADGTVVKMTRNELIADMTPDVFPEGIIINGINVSGMTQDEALSSIQANQPERPLEIDVNLLLDGHEYPLDLSSLPIEVNDREVVAKAFNYLRPTGDEEIDDLIAMHDAREALKTTPATYQTAYTPNTEDISAQVHGVLDPLDRPAVDAVITGFDPQNCTFQYTDSQLGYTIDMDTAVTDVKALLDGGT